MTADHVTDNSSVFDRSWLVEDEEPDTCPVCGEFTDTVEDGACLQCRRAQTQPTGLFSFNDKGLIIIGNPGIEEWRHTYRTIKTIAKDSYRKIGDLLVYGELTYGDLIDQESDESDCDDPVFHPGTLYNAKYVSSRWWPPERRVFDLPWAFYQETSPLKPEQQDELMSMAEQLKINRDTLRQAVTEYQRANGKREYVPTRPADIIAEQQRELDQAREELDRVRRESHAALDSVPGPQLIPGPIAKLIKGVAGYLQGRDYKAVMIHEDGRVEWIPR